LLRLLGVGQSLGACADPHPPLSQTVKNADFLGKWLVLFFYPMDCEPASFGSSVQS